MKELRNKPRVFLSHAKEDKAFIQRIYEDLRRCQIDPWKDDFEIRHGRGWLDEIFESGIPTCDCVLVYLTKDALESAMVKKEIDASLIQKLKDKHVSLLPYVKSEQIRRELRADIEALQAPVWNEENYFVLLPQVVAEIWHSFLERTVETATDSERQRRLQLELELEKRKSENDIFSAGEVSEFTYMRNVLNKYCIVEIQCKHGHDNASKFCVIVSVNLLSLLVQCSRSTAQHFSNRALQNIIVKLVEDSLTVPHEPPVTGDCDLALEAQDELLAYGLIEMRDNPFFVNHTGERKNKWRQLLSPAPYQHLFTAKMYRFKFWMAVNKLLPDRVEWRLLEDSCETRRIAESE